MLPSIVFEMEIFSFTDGISTSEIHLKTKINVWHHVHKM